jgi:hypothetical protein
VDEFPTGRPLTFGIAAAWTLLVAVLVGVAITVIDAAHPGAFVDVVTVAACKVLAYSVVLFAILRVHEPESSIRHVLAVRASPPLLLVLAACVGVGVSPALMWLDGFFAHRFPPSPSELEAYARIFDLPTLGKKCALLGALLVVMPVSDELFFRGALFTPLARGRRVEWVILATATYDALLAGAQPRELASVVATALVISWIRAISGSVVPSIVARVAFSAVQVVPLVVFGRELGFSRGRVWGGLAVAAVALAAMASMGKSDARLIAARLDDE